MTAPQLVGYRDASRLLAIPHGTLRSMVCRRQIPHVRISPRVVVFDVRALDAWVRARCVAANDSCGVPAGLDAIPGAA